MDIDTLLDLSNRVADIARIALEQEMSAAKFPKYFAALQWALWQEPPPFDTKTYAEIFHNASNSDQWLAISLIENAERERNHATQLWFFAACSSKEERQGFKYQAIKKSEHVLIYLELLDLTFPDAIAPAFRVELQQLSPRYLIGQELDPAPGSADERLPSINDLISMNIAELRNFIYERLQGVALINHCPSNNIPSIAKKMDLVLRDKLKNIAYTAKLIESRADNKETKRLPELFCKTLRDLIRNTSEDTVDLAYNLRFGIYP